MMLALAWLRSRHLPLVAGIVAVVALAGGLAAEETLRLPVLRRSVPVPVLIVLVVGLVVAPPLGNRWGGLEKSMPRARLDRALASGLAVTLAVLACLPTALAAGTRFPWTPLLALMAIGVLAATALGPLGWLPPTVLGFTGVYVDFYYAEPIRSGLDAVGVPALSALVLACGAVFTMVGPRGE